MIDDNILDTTPEEEKAIRAMRRLEKIWPDTPLAFLGGGQPSRNEEKRSWRKGRCRNGF